MTWDLKKNNFFADTLKSYSNIINFGYLFKKKALKKNCTYYLNSTDFLGMFLCFTNVLRCFQNISPIKYAV